MRRVNNKDGKANEAMDPHADQPVPDFYAISRANPILDPASERDHQQAVTGLSSGNNSQLSSGLGMNSTSGSAMPSAAPAAASVSDEIALLEQRRRELVLLQLATLQGSRGNQTQHQAYNLPSAPAHQLDFSNNNQLLAMLGGHYGLNSMPGNQAPNAGLHGAPPASAATVQQLMAFQQQLAPAQPQGSLTNALSNNINWNDLLNPKQHAPATTPAPATGFMNLSQQLNGVNLQALLAGGNPSASLQLLGNNSSNHIQAGGEGGNGNGASGSSHAQSTIENGGARLSLQQSQGQPLANDIQKLLQAASGSGSMAIESLESIKRQMNTMQNVVNAPQVNNVDWQRQLGFATAAPSPSQSPQPPATNIADLLAQLQRQAAGGINGAFVTHEQQQRQRQQPHESNGIAPNMFDNGSVQQQNSTAPQASEIQRLLANGIGLNASQASDIQRLLANSGGTNQNELLAMLIGNNGR
jgi:hypothetical protein